MLCLHIFLATSLFSSWSSSTDSVLRKLSLGLLCQDSSCLLPGMSLCLLDNCLCGGGCMLCVGTSLCNTVWRLLTPQYNITHLGPCMPASQHIILTWSCWTRFSPGEGFLSSYQASRNLLFLTWDSRDIRDTKLIRRTVFIPALISHSEDTCYSPDMCQHLPLTWWVTSLAHLCSHWHCLHRSCHTVFTPPLLTHYWGILTILPGLYTCTVLGQCTHWIYTCSVNYSKIKYSYFTWRLYVN